MESNAHSFRIENNRRHNFPFLALALRKELSRLNLFFLNVLMLLEGPHDLRNKPDFAIAFVWY